MVFLWFSGCRSNSMDLTTPPAVIHRRPGSPGRGPPGPPGLSHALTGLLPTQLALRNELRQVVAALTTHLQRRGDVFWGIWIWKSYGNHLKHEDIMGIYIYIYGKNEYGNHMENPRYIYWFIIIWRFPRS